MSLQIKVVVETSEGAVLSLSEEPFGSNPKFYAQSYSESINNIGQRLESQLVALYGDVRNV